MKQTELEAILSKQVEQVAPLLTYTERQRLERGEFEAVLGGLERKARRGTLGFSVLLTLWLGHWVVLSLFTSGGPGGHWTSFLFPTIGLLFMLHLTIVNRGHFRRTAEVLEMMRDYVRAQAEDEAQPPAAEDAMVSA